jgi:hypothetical protein
MPMTRAGDGKHQSDAADDNLLMPRPVPVLGELVDQAGGAREQSGVRGARACCARLPRPFCEGEKALPGIESGRASRVSGFPHAARRAKRATHPWLSHALERRGASGEDR